MYPQQDFKSLRNDCICTCICICVCVCIYVCLILGAKKDCSRRVLLGPRAEAAMAVFRKVEKGRSMTHIQIRCVHKYILHIDMYACIVHIHMHIH